MVNTEHVTTYYIPAEEKQKSSLFLSESAGVCGGGSLLIAWDQTETLLDTNRQIRKQHTN